MVRRLYAINELREFKNNKREIGFVKTGREIVTEFN